MAKQQLVKEHDEIQVGTFDWRIVTFMKNNTQTRRSPTFMIGTYECYLVIYGRNASCDLCWNCSNIYLESYSGQPFNNKTIYTLSVISVNKEFLITKRTSLIPYDSVIPLAIIDDEELKSKWNDFLLRDVLTLRLSWYKTENCIVSEKNTQTMPDLSAEKIPAKCLETLSKDFGHFYKSQEDTDCVLRIGESQFLVHRQVLAARSEVFAAMFHHDTLESRSGVVDFFNVDAAVLSDVINYVYSGQICGLDSDTAVPMYGVADKYALTELRDICLDHLKCNLTVQNVCKAAVLAYAHREMELEKKIILFLEEKLEELEKTENWQNFIKSEWTLASKLLRSALMFNKDKVKKLSSK